MRLFGAVSPNGRLPPWCSYSHPHLNTTSLLAPVDPTRFPRNPFSVRQTEQLSKLSELASVGITRFTPEPARNSPETRPVAPDASTSATRLPDGTDVSVSREPASMVKSSPVSPAIRN